MNDNETNSTIGGVDAIVKRKSRPGDIMKGIPEGLQPGDNARYLSHALESSNLPPIDTTDAKQVEERIKWFFNRCLECDMKPTVNGLCNALGVDRTTFYRWGSGELRSNTHKSIVCRAKGVLEELWEDYMLNGKINPVSGIFIGKNHFGYTDKQEYVLEPRQAVVEETNMNDILALYGSEDEGQE